MRSASLIFPHQLFNHHPALEKNIPVYLIEEELFFTQFAFHKQKILLHRASMKAYQHELIKKGFTVHYIESAGQPTSICSVIAGLAEKGFRKLHVADPCDYLLERRTRRGCRQHAIDVHWISAPDFITPPDWIETWSQNKSHFHQTDFYVLQRKRLNILTDEQHRPVGGKWTYDAENRKKAPKGFTPPSIPMLAEDQWLKEARAYVEKYFSHNPGQLPDKKNPIYWGWTREQALRLLNDFLEKRFQLFGDYEDAIIQNQSFLCHSVLSPMINVGLITPQELIDAVLAYSSKQHIPMNSLEGYLRQVIGWREFISLMYRKKGCEQRTRNFWGFHRKIPKSFYSGTTGIVPIDHTIRKIQKTGYAHHIERLMVLGNFFLLCEFNPDEVYQWFMELFIDAYDWVMVPNVYGMTQFADAGIMTTKPYICGSNYIIKMSDYKKEVSSDESNAWNDIWDGLFWRFMDKQRNFFKSNPRMGMLINTFDKMDESRKQFLLHSANQFLHSIDLENEKTLEQD